MTDEELARIRNVESSWLEATKWMGGRAANEMIELAIKMEFEFIRLEQKHSQAKRTDGPCP